MGNQNDIKLTISADGSVAIAGTEKVTAAVRKMETDTGGLMGKIKEHWLGFSAAVFAAYKVASEAFEYIDLGAKAQQAEASFKAISASMGTDADTLLKHLEDLSGGTIDASDLMQKAVQGMALGLKDFQIEGLLEASRTSARVWGQDVVSTFDTVVTAVGGGVKAMGPLVKMGLVTKEQFETLNKAIDAGAKDLDLYSLVMANHVKQEAEFGLAMTDNAERLQKVKAGLNDIKENIGMGLITVISKIIAGWEIIGATVASAGMKIAAWWENLGKGPDAMKAAVASINQTYEAEIDAIQKKWGLIAEAPKKAVESLAEADARIKAIMEKAAAAIGAEKAAASAKKIAEALQAWKDSVEEMNLTLNQHDQAVVKLWQEYEQLKQKLTELKAPAEAFAEAQKKMFEGLDFQVALEKVKEYKAELETQKTAIADQIDGLKSWRESAVDAYDGAIEAARKYADEIKTIDKLLADSKKFMDSLTPSTDTAWVAEWKQKEALKSLSDRALRTDDLNDIITAMKAYEAFLTAHSKDFGINNSNEMDAYKLLQAQLERLKSTNQGLMSAAQAAANEILQQIAYVDEQITALQERLSNVELILNTDNAVLAAQMARKDIDLSIPDNMIKALELNTDPAVIAAQSAREQIDKWLPDNMVKTITIQTVLVGSSNTGLTEVADPGPAYEAPPEVAIGTNYVQRSGLAYIHQGEAIIPAKQNNGNQINSNASISFAPVTTINITSTGGDAKSLAKQLDIELSGMFRRGSSELQQQMRRSRR